LPTLTTPAVEESFPVSQGLWRFFKHRQGITLLVSGVEVTETRFPYQGDLELYDFVYLGGMQYDITNAEATTLTNAGYGAYIS